jgi:hypothetical protein
MTTTQLSRPSLAALLRWEAAWITFEVIGVGAGLWLTLGTPLADLGAVVLLGVCAVSFAVRWRHYACLPHQR